MAGPFDFLHIKGRSAGSPNELSLDVLDAARAQLDNPKSQRSGRSASRNADRLEGKGNYHGVAGTSTLSAVPEVERRKKARRARTARIWALAIVVAVALASAAGYFGYRFYQEKVDFTAQFNALVGEFSDIDQDLVAIDMLLDNPFSAFEADSRAEARGKIEPALNVLDDITVKAESLKESTRFDADGVALGEVQAAAQARQEMLGAANDVLALSERVGAEVSEANRAWNTVVSADQLAREAANEANSATTEQATVSARDKTSEALGQIKEARSTLEQIEKAEKGRGLDFSPQRTYLDAKAAALDYAVKTSEALLANDRQAAISSNDSYNDKEREAAQLASELPAAIGDQIEALYKADLQQLLAAYQDARTHVANADAALRPKLA